MFKNWRAKLHIKWYFKVVWLDLSWKNFFLCSNSKTNYKIVILVEKYTSIGLLLFNLGWNWRVNHFFASILDFSRRKSIRKITRICAHNSLGNGPRKILKVNIRIVRRDLKGVSIFFIFEPIPARVKFLFRRIKFVSRSCISCEGTYLYSFVGELANNFSAVKNSYGKENIVQVYGTQGKQVWN